MVNWGEEYDEKRRIEAARRLIYSHPSVASRFRYNLQEKQLSAEKNEINLKKNLPTISNFGEINISTPLHCKANSAPYHNTRLKHRHTTERDSQSRGRAVSTCAHAKASLSTSCVKLKSSSSCPILTTRNIFPLIDRCPATTKSSQPVFETANESTQSFSNAWGKRKRKVEEKHRSSRQQVEIHIKSIEPTMKGELHPNSNSCTATSQFKEIIAIPDLWKQSDSVVRDKQDGKPVKKTKHKPSTTIGKLNVAFQ